MKKGIKTALLLGSGSIGGFLVGVIFVGKLFLESENVRNAVAEEIVKDIFGESPKYPRKISYASYYTAKPKVMSSYPWSKDAWPVFPTEKDAIDVFENLKSLSSQYGEVSVADLYDLSSIGTTYQMNGFGWPNSRIISAKGVVQMDATSWGIELPDPIKLK